MATELHPAFVHDFYLFRRKVFKIFGGAFHVYGKDGQLLLYSKQKAFKLKEDFRIYADESMSRELLTIKTPQVLDFGATYYVTDASTHEPVGALARKLLKSMFKDEWKFLAPDNREIGRLTEKSVFGALASRFINLIPQKYAVETADGTVVARINQRFNPFVLKYGLRIERPDSSIDRRLIVAAGVLLAGIEGRQTDYS
ncbi:MAG: hypothetical protein KJ621_03845 [Proteobacteria bacterium]|nr:hypothetical protein [Pseudomonadota bacterium]MBU1742180.1 hypothetical protein [Pseudomonadota bacterium]